MLQSLDKILTDTGLLLVHEQRNWFLQMDSMPGEDAVKTTEMTIHDLEYHINFIDKATVGFERIESNF